MIKKVIFDLDNTLIMWKKDYINALIDTMKCFDVKKDPAIIDDIIESLEKKYEIISKEILLNDKNQAVIKVFVHDLESVISPFSLQDNIVINSEFANFLDQHILATHLIHDINIQIKSNHLEKQEDIVLIQEAIKNYYYEEAIISYRKIRKTIIQSIIFTFFLPIKIRMS